MPVVSMFSNRSGIGKTSLVYHVAWMASLLGHRVLVVDCDPQANLTSAFLEPEHVEVLWGEKRKTIYGAWLSMLDSPEGFEPAQVEPIASNLNLIAGDVALADIEHQFITSGPHPAGAAMNLRASLALSKVIGEASERTGANIVLIDLGSSLDSISRAALFASDHVVIPLAPDVYSIQGLRHLGPTLTRWHAEWVESIAKGGSEVPGARGNMTANHYVVLQQPVRLDRVAGTSERWMAKIPSEFRSAFALDTSPGNGPIVAGLPTPNHPNADEHCLGLVKQFQSLIDMGEQARKPVFLLKSADGAVGAHQQAVTAAYAFYKQFTERLLAALQ